MMMMMNIVSLFMAVLFFELLIFCGGVA